MRKHQRGLSLTGFLSTLTLAILIGITAMRCAPAWLEHAALDRLVSKMEASGETDPATLKTMFTSAASIGDIHSVTYEDLKIIQAHTAIKIAYAYESRVSLTGPVSLLFTFTR